jgi:hypothetical protein
LTALPAGDFQLELVDLVGANILPPDLARLSGLKRLRILNLPGPMWNPLSGARINYSRDLRHIAGITTEPEEYERRVIGFLDDALLNPR